MMGSYDKRIRIGCIADDFTGASDIGSFFVKGGLKTLLTNGIPDTSLSIDASVEVIVIALKIRSVEVSSAVGQALKALEYLQSAGCTQVYFKYCSTFDCTPEGNIGPVTDALLEKTGSPYTIMCPSLPVNGRTVKDGGLYVYGEPLHESPMKDHPVNPMWDHRLAGLLEKQAVYSCLEVSAAELERTKDEFDRSLALRKSGEPDEPCYIIPDYYEDLHGQQIARLFFDLPLITGGSGLAEHLAREHKRRSRRTDSGHEHTEPGTTGGSIIFAGSCSKATRGQVALYKESGAAAYSLSAERLREDKQFIRQLIEEIRSPAHNAVLIHTDGNDPREDGGCPHDLSQKEISALYETTMSDLAEEALRSGITRIIVAGGETSGAITERLGFSSFLLGRSVAPGVPILIPVQNRKVRLVLKSGNFGQPDFFIRALEETANDSGA